MKIFSVVSILLSVFAHTIIALAEDNKIAGPSMPELRAILLDMKERDQMIRNTIGITSPSDEQLQLMKDLDAAHTGQIKKYMLNTVGRLIR